MNKDIGLVLGEHVGSVKEIDLGASGNCMGKFLYVRVCIDISKPLKRGLKWLGVSSPPKARSLRTTRSEPYSHVTGQLETYSLSSDKRPASTSMATVHRNSASENSPRPNTIMATFLEINKSVKINPNPMKSSAPKNPPKLIVHDSNAFFMQGLKPCTLTSTNNVIGPSDQPGLVELGLPQELDSDILGRKPKWKRLARATVDHPLSSNPNHSHLVKRKVVTCEGLFPENMKKKIALPLTALPRTLLVRIFAILFITCGKLKEWNSHSNQKLHRDITWQRNQLKKIAKSPTISDPGLVRGRRHDVWLENDE
ncbi:hypothetical protein ACOSQ3_029183 [Xanthoceras sorbifolium]